MAILAGNKGASHAWFCPDDLVLKSWNRWSEWSVYEACPLPVKSLAGNKKAASKDLNQWQHSFKTHKGLAFIW